jgi:hypothetical protein
MSAGLISLFFSLGVSGWVFSKLQGKTGYGNSQAALKGASVAFVIAFIVMFTLAHSFLH